MSYTIAELESIASQIRAKIIEISYKSRIAHLGSALSCVDILVALYYTALKIDPNDPFRAERDRFILSKGHAAAALFAILASKGFFPSDLLESVGQPGNFLEEHPGPACAPGVEAATGSLGHGLPLGIGMALAGHITKQFCRIFILLGDGECNEGSVWEGAMFASRHGLGSLTAFVDYNKWQATGRSREILQLEPLADKWRSFGWKVKEIDGHNYAQICDALSLHDTGKPKMIVAHTVKGKGVSFMEDDNNWHYRVPTATEVRAAKNELGVQ